MRYYDVSEQVFDDILNYGLTKAVDPAVFVGISKKPTTTPTAAVYVPLGEEIDCAVLRPSQAISNAFKGISNAPSFIRLQKNLTGYKIEESISGHQAYLHMRKILLNYYTEEEYEECLKQHEEEYDEELIQMHYIDTSADFIEKPCFVSYEDTWKYDINGAHQYILMGIFPKAKEAIQRMYNKRKTNPIYKKYINFYVGYLARDGHRKTYNYIVHSVTRIMKEFHKQIGGEIIYANTDGMVVQYPEKTCETSKKLGQFKLEFSGETKIFFGQDKQYLIKCGDDIKGNMMHCVRDMVDWDRNIAVTYNRKLNDYGIFVAENIQQVEVDIYER